MQTPPPDRHTWYTPADCAALLDGRQHGSSWRAKCPAHGSDNPTSLHIGQGQDKYGNPCTLLYCFAQHCSPADICAAMGIEVRNLFAVRLAYAQETRALPRSHSPRLAIVKHTNTLPPGGIAQVLLEEMIVSDPEWIQTCEPARRTLWELAQASPRARATFTACLAEAGITPLPFWEQLAADMGGA